MTVGIDFDFARWLAQRRGTMERQAREGSAYVYTGEVRYRRSLASARPVAIALEAMARQWRAATRDEMLEAALKVTGEQTPRIWAAAQRAGEMLRVRVPALYAVTTADVRIKVLGLDDAPALFVNAELADRLSDASLVAAIGHELGHVQNGHVLLSTALHYLEHDAAFFVRWAVAPAAVALRAWARRAEITCDRAALLACRDLEATLAAMAIVDNWQPGAMHFDAAEFLRDLPQAETTGMFAKLADRFRGNTVIARRVTAARGFADSAYYAIANGKDATGKPSTTDLDQRIAALFGML